jgi:molybdopterin-guanine dinucleotide biosynthesis protein A
MHAIVTAGGLTQPNRPLYEAARGGPKSLIDIAGRPMVQWVLDALGATGAVERVFVVGLPSETNLVCAHPLVLLPDHGDMLANIFAAAREILRADPGASHAILASGDIPALRGEMVEWLVQQVSDLDQDIYYSVVERSTMETHFPASRRTYIALKDVAVCGGDLHCLRLRAANDENPLVKKLIGARKSPLRQAGMIGFDTLLNLVLRRLTLREIETAVCQRLGLRGRAIISPYAETGMDVDKTFQLEMMREHLKKTDERNTTEAEPVRP